MTHWLELAYIDPGSGMIIGQVLASIALTIAFFCRKWIINPIKSLFGHQPVTPPPPLGGEELAEETPASGETTSGEEKDPAPLEPVN